jgi:hypothetical protein
MCNFWSCLLTRDGKVLWDPAIKSHEELVEKYGLKDAKLQDRDFVRLEITPPNNDVMNKKRGDWKYKVDEEGTLPDWYQNDTLAQEHLVWVEWARMSAQMHKHIENAGLNFTRKDAIIERIKAMRPGKAKVSRRTVHASLDEYEKLLKAQDHERRIWGIEEVVFYTPAQWDSVRASVWDSVWASVWASVRASVWDSVWASVRASVWASVWDSVRDSVWASVWDSVRDSVWASVWASVKFDDSENYGIPLLDILDAGCVFYGVDSDGVAHVIIVGKDGGDD